MIQFTKLLPIFFLVNCLSCKALSVHPGFKINDVRAHSGALAIDSNGKNILYTVCNERLSKKENSSDFEEEEDRLETDKIVCDFKIETPSIGAESNPLSCPGVPIFWKEDAESSYVGHVHVQFINDTKVAMQYDIINQKDHEINQRIFKIFYMQNCETKATFYFDRKTEKIFYHSLIAHNNDVEYTAIDETVCKGMDGCRMYYDGVPVWRIQSFRHRFNWFEIYYVNPSVKQSEYYLIGIKDDNTEDPGNLHMYVSYFDKFGNENPLMEQDPRNGIAWAPVVSMSTSHELFSGCWLILRLVKGFRHVNFPGYHGLVQCVQFDNAGMKLNASLKVDNFIFGLTTYVLPNGEIILATGDMKLESNAVASVEGVHIYKIDASGSISKPLVVHVPDVKFRMDENTVGNSVDMAITENLNNELCVRIAYLYPNLNDAKQKLKIEDSKYIDKCVPKDSFNNL